jgi:glutathione S-transferase
MMELIGMLDSPYVRRVAVSLQFLGIPFEHRSISVFRQFDEFRAINPVVKAPTLICDDGTVLMDSTLILDYAETLASPDRSLMPRTVQERQAALRTIGLALVACEKAVQIIYERNLRPAQKQHEPWVDRVTGQLLEAYRTLESELERRPLSLQPVDQTGISTAVTWHFTQKMLPEVVAAAAFPRLEAFSAQAEQLPQFRAVPHGPGTYRHDA